MLLMPHSCCDTWAHGPACHLHRESTSGARDLWYDGHEDTIAEDESRQFLLSMCFLPEPTVTMIFTLGLGQEPAASLQNLFLLPVLLQTSNDILSPAV